MKKILAFLLVLTLSMAGFAAFADEYRDMAEALDTASVMTNFSRAISWYMAEETMWRSMPETAMWFTAPAPKTEPFTGI